MVAKTAQEKNHACHFPLKKLVIFTPCKHEKCYLVVVHSICQRKGYFNTQKLKSKTPKLHSTISGTKIGEIVKSNVIKVYFLLIRSSVLSETFQVLSFINIQK